MTFNPRDFYRKLERLDGLQHTLSQMAQQPVAALDVEKQHRAQESYLALQEEISGELSLENVIKYHSWMQNKIDQMKGSLSSAEYDAWKAQRQATIARMESR